MSGEQSAWENGVKQRSQYKLMTDTRNKHWGLYSNSQFGYGESVPNPFRTGEGFARTDRPDAPL
jgi:hypothetical protein